ncbi:neural cell adhesion molecule 2-like [Anopheles aquasalis]|uniref:neural cell adhesion molecule 2-like n=1 Tax=Anopheles aquasalis TaxID=42839 RepID=UPI00215B498F|nr:neural cell adhesion molecule 2-like [Anopheles aquasalis]
MRNVCIVLFAIFTISGLGENDYGLHTAPTINYGDEISRDEISDNEIELPYGITWKVNCTFRRPVVWKHYDPWFDWEPQNYTSTPFYTGDTENPHGAYLTIRNASATMVGRYYCVPLDKIDEKLVTHLNEMASEEIASSIYVFVKDLAQPLVPVPNINYVQKEGGYIPCKASYRDVEVELYNKFDPSDPLPGRPDPTQGFTVPKSLLFFEDGMLCKCDTANYTIHVVVKNDLPEPIITSATDNFVLQGALIRLNCSITILPSQSVEIFWDIFPPATGTNQRMKIGMLEKRPHPELNNRVVFSRELIIENATVQDGKIYQCAVVDNQNNTNYNSYKLTVHEKSDNYAELTSTNNRAVINRKRNTNGEIKPIDILIKDRSYPSNISYPSAKDDPLLSDSSKDKYLMEQTENYVRLTINDPTVNDTGVYTTVEISGAGNEFFDATVIVHGKPFVYMESKYANSGDEEVEFTCYVVGYPLPEVWFGYQRCDNVPWQNCSYAEEATIDEKAVIKSYGIKTKGVYKKIAEHPGIVYCTASNSEGSETTQAYLLMRSRAPKTQLERIPADGLITVGDNVTFICSVIDVDSTIIPTSLRFLTNDKELSQSDRVHQSFFYESEFLKSQLTLINVSLDMSGRMNCRIKSKDAYDTSKAVQFEVVAPIAPRLLSGKEHESIEKRVSESLTLHCHVTGTPQPDVTWTKEGGLQNNNTSLHANGSLSIHSLTKIDFGFYECRAENKAGNITQAWNVKQVKVESTKSIPWEIGRNRSVLVANTTYV